VSRATRFPYSFGQRVDHPGFTMPFRVIAQTCDKIGDWTISVTDEKGGGWWKFPANELAFHDLSDEQAAMAPRDEDLGMIGKLLRKIRHWFRSAATGRFVSADYADHHRDTTTRESSK
jgi:hypothetical protein